MSDEKLGYRECYICKAAIPPLVSICYACGYSQLPNPNAQGNLPAGGAQQDGTAPSGGNTPARNRLRADLGARLDQAKDDLRARLKRK